MQRCCRDKSSYALGRITMGSRARATISTGLKLLRQKWYAVACYKKNPLVTTVLILKPDLKDTLYLVDAFLNVLLRLNFRNSSC